MQCPLSDSYHRKSSSALLEFGSVCRAPVPLTETVGDPGSSPAPGNLCYMCVYDCLASGIINLPDLHVASPYPLAPPTGQSLKYVYARNFWTVRPKFTSKVPLESLDHAESNTPYDVMMRRDRFSAILDFVKNLQKFSRVADFVQFSPKSAQTIYRQMRTKWWDWIFQFRFRLHAAANRNQRRRRRFRCKLISRQRCHTLTSYLGIWVLHLSQVGTQNLGSFGL